MPSRRLPTASPSLPSHHHVDIAAAALRANQAPLPFRHWCPWRTPAGLLAGVKLNSVFLCVTPDHTPRRRCQGHWRRRLTADRRSFSTPLPVPLIKRVTERSRRQNASKCHQRAMTNAVRKIIGFTMMVFFFCTCCSRGACPPPAPSSRDHTSAPARPGQVRSLAHGGRLVRPVKVSGFIGVRNRWSHPGTVQLVYSFCRP